MATEEQKKQNQIRLMSLALLGLSAGVWDMLGESAYAVGIPMGNTILPVMEKEMGLEIGGESPEAVLQEIARIFVDEFGFASTIEVKPLGDDTFQLVVANCANRTFTDKLIDAGVPKPYICPIMNVSASALRRLGYRPHDTVEKWAEGKGSIITFELM